MSSSDDEDDDRQRLLEAVDPGHQKIFDKRKDGKKGSNGVSSSEGKNRAAPQSSNRRDKQNGEASHASFHSDLKVTPEFRVFVARKLGESIDKNVKEKRLKFSFDKEGGGDERLSEDDNPGRSGLGVHLFSDSSACLELEDPESQQTAKKRKKPDLLAHRKNHCKRTKRKKAQSSTDNKSASSSSSSEESDSDLKSVAVSSDWILSQKGVY